MYKKLKNNKGLTLAEVVIVLAIMGILSVTVLPMYSKLQLRSQNNRNLANMVTIQEVFRNYYYYTYSAGKPHYPPSPSDSLMTEEWANTPMDSSLSLQTPNELFGTGNVPTNSNGVPFLYRNWVDIMPDGRKMRRMVIKDTDPDSPSYGESLEFTI